MFAEMFDAFFDTTGFAVPATLTVSGTPSAVTVIFDAAYVDPLGQIEGSVPMVWLTTSEAGAVVQGDTILVGATTYTVVEVMPDGTGITQLRLRT